LRSIHDELDAAVLAAYGWSDLRAALADFSPANAESRELATNTLLERLVALNSRRAAEESADQVRWLRPEYQTRDSDDASQNGLALSGEKAAQASALPLVKQAWPAELPEQVKAVADLLATQPGPMARAAAGDPANPGRDGPRQAIAGTGRALAGRLTSPVPHCGGGAIPLSTPHQGGGAIQRSTPQPMPSGAGGAKGQAIAHRRSTGLAARCVGVIRAIAALTQGAANELPV
jgi:hypothetical protein